MGNETRSDDDCQTQVRTKTQGETEVTEEEERRNKAEPPRDHRHEFEAKEVFKQGGVAYFDVAVIHALRRPWNCISTWNVWNATPSGIIYARKSEWCYHWWRPPTPDSQGRNSKVVGARTTGVHPEWRLNEKL